MKKYFTLIALLIIKLNTQAQTNNGINTDELKLIQQIIDTFYIQQIPNDTVSERMYNEFFHLATKGLPLFSTMERNEMAVNKLTFLEKFKQGDTAYFNTLNTKINTRKKNIELYLFDTNNYNDLIDGNQKLILRSNNSIIEGTESDIKINLKKYIYTQLLYTSVKYYDDKTTLDKSSLETRKKNISKLLDKFIEKNKTQSFLQSKESLYELLCKAWISALDPHSNYFTIKQFEEFSNSLSNNTDSYGFSVNENYNKQLIIETLIPGGSAWKSNQLYEGDELISLQFEKDNPIELVFYDDDDINQLLNAASTKMCTLKVKNKFGIIEDVELIKQRVINVDNIFQGYMLHHDNKIGYVALPSFYTNSSLTQNNNSANDLAKAIIKLNKDSIEGLILDLRNNGGGDMEQAIDIAGLFIDVGPVGIAATKVDKPTVLKDVNHGTIFDKPLIILINQFSASASEFLASTLQDHGRAIIVGQTSYGKGTIQTTLPIIGQIINNKQKVTKANTKNLNILKLTIGKFYRINGQSVQAKGVQPDIKFPDWFSKLKLDEKYQPYIIHNDSIIKKTYYTPLQLKNIPQIAQQSQDRILKNIPIQKMGVYLKTMINRNESREISLSLDKFYSQYFEESNLKLPVEKIPNEELDILINSSDKALVESEYFIQKMSNNEIQKLREDPFVLETFKIIQDYIHLSK